MIYFDNAATSFPKPECVISATARALRENSANPGVTQTPDSFLTPW